MEDGILLNRKTREELKQIAQGLGVPKAYALKKDDLITAIETKRKEIEEEEAQRQQSIMKKKKERPADVVEVEGVLDVMNDGFGFLRVTGLYRCAERADPR